MYVQHVPFQPPASLLFEQEAALLLIGVGYYGYRRGGVHRIDLVRRLLPLLYHDSGGTRLCRKGMDRMVEGVSQSKGRQELSPGGVQARFETSPF